MTAISPATSYRKTPVLAIQMIRKFGKFLMWLIGILLLAITALPVAALPFISAVPLPVCGLLITVDLTLIILLNWRVRSIRGKMAVMAGWITVMLLGVAASQTFASTAPITEENSIAVMEKVRLGGSDEWISIRGKNADNPVLLFAAGGPGACQMICYRQELGALEEHFVVVYWDQPGSGKSYGAVPFQQLTIDRYGSDAHELTLMLRSRFHRKKIYFLGESWGSMLGLRLVQQYPDLYYAYIGAGQVINTKANFILGYELALKLAAEEGNTELVEKLKSNGPRPYSGSNWMEKYIDFQILSSHYMLEHTGPIDMNSKMLYFLRAPEYGILDKANYFRPSVGYAMIEELDQIDFERQPAHQEVPVYFLEGRWDTQVMSQLAERYFNQLETSKKELIWFEKSGHTPIMFEPDQVVDVLVNQVLVQTPPQP